MPDFGQSQFCAKQQRILSRQEESADRLESRQQLAPLKPIHRRGKSDKQPLLMSCDDTRNVIWASSEQNRETVKRMEHRFLKTFKRNVLHKTYLNQANLTQLNKHYAERSALAPSAERSNIVAGNFTNSKIKHIEPLKTEFTKRDPAVDKPEAPRAELS